MKSKYTALTDQLYEYLCTCRSGAEDPVLDALRRETEALGEEVSRMQISREQGSFLTLLAASVNARFAVEIGTFTGFSAICIARGLAKDGRLIAIDRSKEWTEIAQRYWVHADLANKIELRLSDAIPALKSLEPDWKFDFAFIDGHKPEYDSYYELLLPRMRPNGLILFDNMLWSGKLVSGSALDPSGCAIDALNRKLASDERVEAVLLPIADGIQLCRKR